MRWLLTGCLAVLLAACGSSAGTAGEITSPSPVVQPAVSPEALTEALTGMSSLEAAAAQLAGALGVKPEAVRVRIQDSRCSLCNIETRAKLGMLEGLSVDEAAPLIETNMMYWLVADDLVCEYELVSGVHTPRACRLAP